MTASEKMTSEEMLAELYARVDVLEQTLAQKEEMIAEAVVRVVMDRLSEDVVRSTLRQFREDWLARFLPELREMVMAELLTWRDGPS